MWRALESQHDVEHGQMRLQSLLLEELPLSVACRAGYQGGSLEVTAWWSDQLGVWFATRRLLQVAVPRYWNALGTERPSPGGNVSIVCEVNFPIRGISRKVQGVVATGDRGELHILHRGGIGGGRPGIGKDFFFKHYRGEKGLLFDGHARTEVAWVAKLATGVGKDVSRFVLEVERIKALAV